MAYGKGQQNLQRRAIPTGKTSLVEDVLPSGKLSDLLLLREGYLSAANTFVDAVFSVEPLAGVLASEEMNRILLAKQKAITGLNKAYVEKARLSVPNAISQVEEKYLNRLVGRLRHCATSTGEKNPAKRQYLNIPLDIQDQVSLKQLEEIEKKVSKLGYAKTLAWYADIIVNDSEAGSSPEELLVIRAIHADCLGKYRNPEYGRDPRYTCQIHLDYRVIRNKVEPVSALDKGARILVDQSNKKFHYFLEISNPQPRGDSIRIPITMSSNTLKRFDRDAKTSSLVLEISQTDVTVKTVISKPDQPATDIKDITHLIARDFGYVNTVSLTVAKLDKEIDPAEVDRIAKFTRDEALKYLQSSSHPNDNIVKRMRFSGRAFLGAIAAHCEKIDRLKSQIDTGYNKLDKLKGILCGYIGLKPEELLAEGMVFKDRFVQNLYDKFFRLLGHIRKMKSIRLRIYEKIRNVKKAWFGFLSNQEVLLAREFNAAIVREDLTVMATEKEGPGYKGRTFNKMINNGSKGQYIRRATDKLTWDGIPELLVPSYYTSTSCTIHSLVDSAMRKGEKFACPLCSAPAHADEHAADTIANYLLLRPV